MRKLQLPHFVLLYAILIIAFIACKKNDISRIVTPAAKCRIATAAERPYNIIDTFSYDDSNRLVSLKHQELSAPYQRYYSYKGDSIISYLQPGVDPNDYRILLNSFGLIATEVQSNYGNMDSTIYTYDANGLLLLSTKLKPGYFSSTVEYTFFNGDNIYQKYTNVGVTIDTLSYYTDKLSVPGNFDEYIQLTNYGAYIYKNKHLLKSVQSGSTVSEYKYDFDEKGNISTIYLSDAMFYDTIHFTYTCP